MGKLEIPSMYYVAAALLVLSGLFYSASHHELGLFGANVCSYGRRSATARWSSLPAARWPPPGACSSASSSGTRVGAHALGALPRQFLADGGGGIADLVDGLLQLLLRYAERVRPVLDLEGLVHVDLAAVSCPRFVRLSIACPPSWKSKTPPWTGRSKRQDRRPYVEAHASRL